MQNFSILNALLQSVFTGFGIVIPIVALLRTVNLKKLAVKEAFVLTAVQVLRLAGILYFILFCVDAYLQYNATHKAEQVVVIQSPLFGPYWFAYWGSPVMYLLLSQLFWIKKLYIEKAALITLAVLLLLLPSQRVISFITFSLLNNDYLPSSWTMYHTNTLFQVLLNVVVFVFVVFAVMTATGKVKKLAEQN